MSAVLHLETASESVVGPFDGAHGLGFASVGVHPPSPPVDVPNTLKHVELPPPETHPSSQGANGRGAAVGLTGAGAAGELEG